MVRFVRMVSGAVIIAAVAALAGSAFGVVTVDVPAKVGDTFGGRTVTGVGEPFTDADGNVGFLMIMNDGTRSIYHSIVGEAFNTSSVVGHTITGGEDTIGISAAGGWIYSPTYDGGDAVYTHAGLLLNEGQAHPGAPGLFSSFNSRPRMSSNGTAWWIGGTTATSGGTTSNRGLFKNPNPSDPSQTVAIEMGGMTISGLTLSSTASGFAYDISDNANHYIRSNTFTGVPTTSDTGIVVNGSLVMREGDPTGQGDFWQNWRFVGINDSGNFTVCGDTSAAADDFITFNTSIIARQGDTIAGVTLGATVDMVSINNLNQIAAIWDLTPATDEVLLFGDGMNFAATAQVLLRVGDLLDIDGDTVADFTLTDFNASAGVAPGLDISDSGKIYVNVDITPIGGGTAIEAIIGVAIPAPGAAGLMALAAIAGARRRR